MKLALGTVQFGLAYGVANTQGQVSLPVAAEILRAAQQAGIDTLDTAIAYGNSEDCLGQIGV
jgi:aryl-alcohol dehydrogenase-like predicted oxidoreductase